jgi:hypothetical protein
MESLSGKNFNLLVEEFTDYRIITYKVSQGYLVVKIKFCLFEVDDDIINPTDVEVTLSDYEIKFLYMFRNIKHINKFTKKLIPILNKKGSKDELDIVGCEILNIGKKYRNLIYTY